MQVERVIPGRGWWLLGPQPVAELGGPVAEIVPGRWLSVAPGLGVVSAESSRARVTLVGYALDPDDAGVSDAEVASVIAQGWDGPSSLPVVTARFGGRWMVVVDDGRSTFVGQDTFGLRWVLYGPDGWCSGSEVALRRHAGAVSDPEAAAFAARVQPKTWPGDTTALTGVRRLLPSQVLDLGRGEPVTVPLTAGVPVPERPEAALDAIARSMAGTMAAAVRRFPLVMLLTGGADSRSMLAACRGLTDRIRFVTIDNPAIAGSDADAKVASVLADVLGLDHHVVRATDRPSPSFAALADAHAGSQPPLWAANNEAVATVVPANAVGVTGHTGEVWRGTLNVQIAPGGVPDADWFLALRRLTGEPFAETSLRSWFAAADRNELPVIGRVLWDLDYSARNSAWVDATDLIWADYLSPMGSRAATTAVMALPEHYRDAGPVLMEELSRRLWPEALEASVLPKVRLRRRSLSQRVRFRVAGVLHR